MFTGIIETTGVIKSVRKSAGAYIRVQAERAFVDSLAIGASVSINGACQTVTEKTADAFLVYASDATLTATAFNRLTEGTTVNLERALPVNGRFDGHIVTGHIDGVARVVAIDRREGGTGYRFSLEREWARYIAKKGSVAVNGISLTVYDVSPAWFDVAVIPHTQTHTTLSALSVGDYVNIEADTVAKYVERLLRGEERKDLFTQFLAED